jgi:hypothetical protein
MPSAGSRYAEVRTSSSAVIAAVFVMDYSDYLREQAAECRRLAEAASDPATQEDLFESAAIYEEVANDLDDRRCSG